MCLCAMLFEYVLLFTYFVYDGTFCEQVDGVAMGSPFSLVIVDFFMESFEKMALEAVPFKPMV